MKRTTATDEHSLNDARRTQRQSNAHSTDAFPKALAYLMFGITCGLGLDLCAKALLTRYSLEQFIFLRSLLGVLIFLGIARWYGGLTSLRTSRWGWHFVRTLLATVTMFGFFYGLERMHLVNALTLVFAAPLIVTALSVPVLAEHVGWRRWLAVVVGFVGVLVVLRPGAGIVDLASIAVLAAAAGYAGLALTARKLAATETTFALSVYVMGGPLLVSAVMLQDNYTPPDALAWLLFVLAGLCSAGAWIGVVGGYRRVAPAVLAPFEYTALLGAAAAGYLIWSEVPDRYVVIGGAIIISSGVYVAFREIGSRAVSTRYLRAFTADSAAAIARRLRGRT